MLKRKIKKLPLLLLHLPLDNYIDETDSYLEHFD